MPGFAEMTKKKGRGMNGSGVSATPSGKNFTPLSESRNFDVMRSSVMDLRNSFTNDQMDGTS